MDSPWGIELGIDLGGGFWYSAFMDRFRSHTGNSVVLFFLSVCLLFSVADRNAKAAGRELIRNGGFETGNLQNWSQLYDSNGTTFGSFTKSPVGAATPRQALATAANPAGGTSFALSDQRNVSYQILFQKFRVPRGTRRVIMTYQMFVTTMAPVVFNPAVFSTAAGPNQQARVDLLKGTASDLDTTSGVVAQLYTIGADAVTPPSPVPYLRYRFNLSRKVTPGKTYKIRFGTVVSAGALNLGVDNVSVKAY
jgi:hypothetical protein